MARGKLIRGNHGAQLDIKRGLMASAQSLREANAPGESTHPQIWIRTGIGSRSVQTRRTSKRISHFYCLSPFRANLSRDTVAVLVLNCCQLHIYTAKTAHRFEADRDE